MKKQAYKKPAMNVVTMELEGQLMDASTVYVNRTESNVGITGGNQGSTEAARVKGNYVNWDDDWSE